MPIMVAKRCAVFGLVTFFSPKAWMLKLAIKIVCGERAGNPTGLMSDGREETSCPETCPEAWLPPAAAEAL
jgi:hypothetical protein